MGIKVLVSQTFVNQERRQFSNLKKKVRFEKYLEL